jgi:low temperature requirement protein LtrA
MTEQLTARPQRQRRWTRPMPLRNHAESHRASTPLELLFDLCFVVSVAMLAAELHHAAVEGHALDGGIRYLLLFLPVWWTWMLFSWFASAFDNDDVPYRLLTLLQMVGVLGMAASMPTAFKGDYVMLTFAFAAARLPLVAGWLRGARHLPPEDRGFALRYATGIAGCTALWLALLAVPTPARYIGYVVLLVLELSVPMWAVASTTRQCFHLGHITERYGLFTLIVLGESILAAATAINQSLSTGITTPLVVIGIFVLISAFAVWWLYFDFVDGRALVLNNRAAFLWGYGHLLVFAAIGAMGAGAQIAVEAYQTQRFDLSGQLSIGLPAAVCVAAIAWIRSLSANSAQLPTMGRIVSSLLIVVVAVTMGADPMLTTVAVAAVLVLQATAETVWRGLHDPTSLPS